MGHTGGNQPPSNFSIQIVTLLLIAAGPGLLGLLGTFATNPSLAIGVSLLWGALVLGGRLLLKAWMPVEDEITKNTSQSIIAFLRNLRERKYRQPYLQHLIYSHRTFDVKGLSAQGPHALELERVFVSLNMIPQTAPGRGVVPREPAPVVPREPTPVVPPGAKSIWDFLNAPGISHLVILGAPGSGKTTLLKFAAMALAGRNRQSSKEIPAKLPVLLFLRDHAGAIVENPDVSLPEIILNSLKRMPKDECPTEDWFERNLKRGDCLIMLDGLDEVSDPKARRAVVKWVEGMMTAWHRNRFILTSRPGGYRDNPLSGVTQLEVRPFNREQIRQFVTNWYLATELMAYQKDDPGVRMEAAKSAEELLKRIENTPDIAELAVNPLLLTMIASVHRFRSSLPGRRVELYAEMCDVFLGKRKQAEGVEDNLTPAQKQRVLQPLAFEMLRHGSREVSATKAANIIAKPLGLVAGEMPPADYLRLIEDGSGILIERKPDEYSFSHKTFQEFMTAVYVQQENRVEELIRHIDDEYWHETIRLYCARADASPVISACLAQDPPPIGRLVLATECLEESLEVQPEVRKQLETILEDNLESTDPDLFRLAAEAKLARRLRRFTRLDDDTHYDPELISCAEFQLFLDDSPANEAFAPDHWEYLRFLPEQATEPIQGLTSASAQAFARWCEGRQSGVIMWHYRLPDVEELNLDDGYWVRGPDERWLLAGARGIERNFEHWLAFSETSSITWKKIIRLSSYNPDNFLTGYTLITFLAFAGTRNLGYTLNRVLDRFRAHSDIVLLDHDRELIVARSVARVRNLIRNRAIFLNIDRDLSSDFARARDLADVLAHTRAFALARDLARARDLAQIVDRNLARAVSLDRVFINLLVCGLTELLIEEFDKGKSFDQVVVGRYADLIEKILPRLETSSHNKVQPSVIYRLRSIIPEVQMRAVLLKELNYLNKHEPPLWNIANRAKREQWEQNVSEIMHAYATLALLEKRRRGEPGFEPFEGLRLVRERRKDGQR